MPEFETRVLAKWKSTNHIEDVTIYDNEDVPDAWYHVMFDGESFTEQPSHWMNIPE